MRRHPVTVAALGLVLFAIACGDTPQQDAAPFFGTEIGGAGVSLRLPGGWVGESGNDRLIAAEFQADIGAVEPSGGRLTVLSAAGGVPSSLSIDAPLVSGEGVAALAVLEQPKNTTVGGHAAVMITFRDDSGAAPLVQRIVFVNPGAEVSLQFVLEAPGDRWPEVEEALTAALRTVEIIGAG